jgi:hypothetical protein
LEEGSLWKRKWSPDIDRGDDELLNWDSISVIGEEEDQENEFPEVVVKVEGNPEILAAWRCIPSIPV